MKKLKEMRLKRKMRLRDIASIVHTTPQTVQQMENRGIQNPKTALRYAKALNCKWQDLLEDPKPEAAQ